MKVSTADLARQIEGLPKPWLPFGHEKNNGRKRYPRVTHELTEEQTQKVREAIGDGNDWPKHTDDPYVNFVVDCLVSFEGCERPSWDELRTIYVEEVETAKQMGLD